MTTRYSRAIIELVDANDLESLRVMSRVTNEIAIAAAAVVAVLLINLDFYRLLRRHRSLGFAMAAIPIHILYYLSNVLSAPVGWFIHQLFGERYRRPRRRRTRSSA